MNKDILSIIKTYARPNLWLYWIDIDTVAYDPFEYSCVIEAESIEDVYIHIVKKHIDYFMKRQHLIVHQTFIKAFMNLKDCPMTSECHKCVELIDKTFLMAKGYVGLTEEDSLCINHFPSLSQINFILFGQDGRHYRGDVNSLNIIIEGLVAKKIVQIKKIEY